MAGCEDGVKEGRAAGTKEPNWRLEEGSEVIQQGREGEPSGNGRYRLLNEGRRVEAAITVFQHAVSDTGCSCTDGDPRRHVAINNKVNIA